MDGLRVLVLPIQMYE